MIMKKLKVYLFRKKFKQDKILNNNYKKAKRKLIIIIIISIILILNARLWKLQFK